MLRRAREKRGKNGVGKRVTRGAQNSFLFV
jgi:hypothetical protein